MIWLIGAALAQELPEPPVRAPDLEGDCTHKAPAPAGVERDCAAVSVPPAYLGYLEETRVYADQLRLHLVAQRAIADADARAATDAIAWRDAQLEARQPNGTLEVLGYVGIGVVMTLGAAWALGEIGRVTAY